MNENYTEARKIGNKEVRRDIANGRYPYVSALEYHKPDYLICAKKNIGLMEIPVDLVAGTLTQARATTFSHNFYPIGEDGSEFASKWASVYNYQIEEGISDPIKVYEYNHLFYVIEGNKRVSVTRYIEMSHIMADVSRIDEKPYEPLYEEFLAFFECTSVYDFYFTVPGSYKKLAKLAGASLEEKWSKELIKNLIVSLDRFRKIFKKRNKDKDYSTCCDAFLIYVDVYGIDSLKTVSDKELENNYLKINKEIESLSGGNPINLVDKPEPESIVPLPSIRNIIPILDDRTNVAFVYESNPMESASVYNHELGRLLVDERSKNIQTFCYHDGNAETIEEAAKNADVIFTTSPLLYDDTFHSSIKHPNVKFYNCSIYQSHASVETYEIRMYEAKFLLGALSAMLTDNHVLGYIADVPTYGTFANINAFAIGASMIDSNIKVYLGWKETLDQDWQNQMRYLNIKVFSGPEFANFVDYSPEYGIYQLRDNDVLNLAMPLVHWDVYYEKLIKSFENNPKKSNGKAINEWWGMREGVLDIMLSSSLPYTSRKMIMALKKSLMNGTILPFAGELHSQEGIIKEDDSVLSIEDIATMNWLNENIIGVIPHYHELTDMGKALTDISGVKKI